MAEPTKRTTNNSTSKARKSKNDIIRSKVGTYLKQQSYSMNEKFRKSDLALTQTTDQYEFDTMIVEDSARAMSFLYSNVLCLSNNQSQVELQFSKFLKFVQSQTVPAVKTELQILVWPLLCHMYAEMIKGRDSRPAAEILRKYAHLIGPIENLYSPVVSEMNGQPHANQTQTESQQQDSQHKDATSPPLPSSTTQIIFAAENADAIRSRAMPGTRMNDIDLNSNDISDYFKELVQSLSLCLRIDEINSIDIARHFRSKKCDMVISLRSLYALRNFFSEDGHVIILSILNAWFSFEILELLIDLEKDSDEDMDDADDMEFNDVSNNGIGNNGSDVNQVHSDSEEFDFRDTNCRLNSFNREIRSLITKCESEIRTVNGMNKSIISGDTGLANRADSFPTPSLTDSLPTITSARKSFSVVQNKYLQNVRAAVLRSRKLDFPMRVFNVLNADHQLSCCDVDPDECHLVCGFDEATIKLWQLNKSKMRGRKPYSSFSNRLCEWSLDDCESSSSSSSDIDSDDGASNVQRKKTPPVLGLFARKPTKARVEDPSEIFDRIPNKSKRKVKQEFMEKRHEDNIFADGGVVALRGHNKGVTDILFSRYNPLIFSVSKDNTMRAWKAMDYRCGAIYRGHNYPIWCVAESPAGLYLATGSRDSTARLWSTDREHPLETFIGHTQDIDAIAFHPNGNYFATGSTDLTVRLWDVTSGKVSRIFIDCHLPVHCVSFSPDGKYLAAGGEESKIRIFDLAAGSQLNELKDHSADVNSIVWNSSGTKLASCCADGSVRIFSVNKIAQSSSNSSSNTPTASTSTSSSSSSSNSSNNKLLISNDTGCKRALKVFFNCDDTISCIGSS